MGYLPPVGWADVATKHDLTAGLENLDNVLRTAMLREHRNLVLAMIASNASLAVLAFTAARLA